MNVTFTLNGRLRNVNIEPGDYLVDTLRQLGLRSVRRGCDSSSCGVCTILVDNKPVPSCTTLTARMDNKTVTTVEGIPKEASLLADEFGKQGADQCGFCNPGIALSAYALKLNHPNADETMIRHFMVGHLCRCTGYVSQTTALKAYLEGKR